MRSVLPLLLALATLAAALPHGAAEPAGEEDPPELRFVRLSSASLQAGQALVVTLGVADASGVAQVFAEIRGPQDRLRLYSDTRCEHGQGRTVAELDCPFPLAETLPAGTYQVWAMQLNDVLWNSASLRSPDHFAEDADHQLSFTVASGNHDLDGPVLHRVEATAPAVAAGHDATFLLHASDATGLGHASLSLAHEAGSPATSGPCAAAAGTSAAIPCTLPIPASFPAGRYRITGLELADVNGVRTSLHATPWGSTLPAGPGNETSVLVESRSADTQAPRLLRLEAPLLPVQRGQRYAVQVWADDAEGVASAFMVFENDVGRRYWRKHLDVQPADCTPWASAAEPVTCTDTVPLDFPLGEVRLMTLFLRDPATNEALHVRAGSPVAGRPVPEDGLNRTRFWVGPRPLADAGLPSLVSFEPQLADVAAGTVLPVVGRLGGVDGVANLTFSFLSQAGGRLGALGCDPGARAEAAGFLCGLILPPGTPAGRYALDEVLLARADGTATRLDLPGDAPSFTVTADPEADAGAPLPEGWPDLVEGGYTLARFNSGASLAPLRAVSGPAPGPAGEPPSADGASPGPDGAAADAGEEDGGPSAGPGQDGLQPVPRRGSPAGPAALLGLAAAALLRRPKPGQRR